MLSNLHKSPSYPIIGTLFFVLIGVFFVWKAQYAPLSDFANYYFGTRFWWEGESLNNIYETYIFNQKIYLLGYKQVFVSYTAVPPSSILAYLPFMGLEIYTAKLFFNLLGLSLFAYSFYRICIFLKLNSIYLIFTAFIFIIPLRNNIYFGQTYFYLLFFLLEGFLAYQRKNYALASIFWALVISLKIFPMVIFGFLIFKKDWKATLYLGLAVIVLNLLTLFILGESILREYFLYISPRLAKGDINNPFTPIYQSMYVLLKDMLVYDAILNPKSYTNHAWLAEWVHRLYQMIILFYLITLSLSQKLDNFSKFALWLGSSLFLSGYGSSYSLIFLILPLLAILSQNVHNQLIITIVILLFFIANLPIQYFLDFRIPFQFPRLYLMLIFLAFWISIYQIKFQYRYLILGLIFTSIFQFLTWRADKDSSEYFFKKEDGFLILDYENKDNKLLVNYFGSHEVYIKQYDLPNSLRFSSDLKVYNRQIHYQGKQITFSNDRKRNPCFLNNNEIIYLSDKNRGVGFYTLRKLKINQNK